MRIRQHILNRLGVYCLLLAFAVLLCVNYLPDAFPFRNASAIYLMTVCTGLILYYSYRVARSGGLQVMMRGISWLELLLVMLRGIKYSVFTGVETLARQTWYLFYVPILLIPLFLFYISLLVSDTESGHIRKKWHWMPVITVALILLVLTNDLHQQSFRFHPNFANWDADYGYGWVFYAVTVWEFSLYLAAMIILAIKCRITGSKKWAWTILLPFAFGITSLLLLATGNMPKINGRNAIQFPETIVFMVAGAMECCVQLGMIPTNNAYGKLFRVSSVSAQITDYDGKPIYKADASADLTPEQFAAPDGTRIDEHTVLHRMNVPGGVGFWQDDVSEQDHLNEKLAEAKERLSDELELMRMQNELRERQAKIAQRTYVYDTIAKQTQKQSRAICRLAEAARKSDDEALKNQTRRRIALLGAYIKRYANLMLLSENEKCIAAGEFALSVSEVLRYLNLYGIPGELLNTASGTASADAVLDVFEAFETLLEMNLSAISGVYANLSDQNARIAFKIAMENLKVIVPEGMQNKLFHAGVHITMEYEDDITYICFTLPNGGDAA